MNIYKQIKQIAELNEQRTELVNELLRNDFDVDDLNFNEACFIRGCVEEGGHLYDKDGKKLDNCGLVDNDYYCKQYNGYIEDEFYGTLYYATDEEGTFIEVPFYM